MDGKKRRILFIVNPKSGKGLIKNHLLEIIDVFVKDRMDVEVYVTQRKMDACRVTRRRAQNYDIIVCSGGDGTLDEVVTGMMELPRQQRAPVGYIPAGSTNDFAGSLGLPANMKNAAICITLKQPFRCDVGGFNENYFVYIAAFGAFTDVSYQTKQEVKNVLGHLAYVLEGAKRLFNLKSYRVKIHIGEELIEDDFIFGMVTNSHSVGGFKSIAGNVFKGEIALDDGLFEVTLIKMPKNPMELNSILAALAIQNIDTAYMYSFKSGNLTVESADDVAWTLDGEFGGKHKTVKLANDRQAMDIMVSGGQS